MTHREEMVRTEMTGSGRESFVLRVWLEEPVRGGRRAPWRGRIIHVPSSAELHSGDLGRIFGFVAEHLDRMGARLPLPRRLALWLSRQVVGRSVPEYDHCPPRDRSLRDRPLSDRSHRDRPRSDEQAAP